MGVDGDDEVYTIEYGDHDLYVPLPFAVGTIDFILQKGVKSVKINGKKILECDGSKVEYSNEQSHRAWNKICFVHISIYTDRGNLPMWPT